MKKCLILSALLMILPFSSCKNDSINYLKTEEEFANALISGSKTIYVNNIVLDGTKTYNLNYDVSIIGKVNLSTLSNGHFNIDEIKTDPSKQKILIKIENIEKPRRRLMTTFNSFSRINYFDWRKI